MLKKDVKVGGRYRARISGKDTVVRITECNKLKKTDYRKGGTSWIAINEATGREVHIKSAMKLRGPPTEEDTAPAPKVSSLSPQKSPERAKGVSVLDALRRERDTTVRQATHVVVEALAGTGKTFTLIVGVVWALAQDRWKDFVDELGFEPVPSEEQMKVWKALRESADSVDSVTYCAFNKSIVTEFGEKWGWMTVLLREVGLHLKFSTVNSLGNAAVAKAFGRVTVTDSHVENLLSHHLGVDIRELRRRDPELVAGVSKLVGLCKLTLAGWTKEDGFNSLSVTEEALDEITRHYDIPLNGHRARAYELVPILLDLSLEVDKFREIDFNDQNWLPVVLGLSVQRSDLLMVDEGQDLPRCKQEFARLAGRRIFLVGDVNQAIYGFAGADTESIPRMKILLGEEGSPIKPLVLTETRRCGKSIVNEANKVLIQIARMDGRPFVPFTAHEDNCKGTVRHTIAAQGRWMAELEDGDMVLCRVNAPLVSYALRLLRDGRKAIIRGRNFGDQLINFVTKMSKSSNGVSDLIQSVDDWHQREVQKEAAKRNSSDSKLIALGDKRDCVLAFAENAITVTGVKEKIQEVFAGKQCPKCHRSFREEMSRCPVKACKTEEDSGGGSWKVGPLLITPKGVTFSSVHRAKGLESERVFILIIDGASIPHPMAKSRWEILQEYNLKYVAITRAIEELIWVS